MSTELLIDLNTLRSAHATMQGKFLKIMNYYFEDTETYLTVMEAGLASADISQIIPAAHTIKSSSKQLGAEVMAREAAEIETIARQLLSENKLPAELIDKIHNLKRSYEITKGQLELAIKEIF